MTDAAVVGVEFQELGDLLPGVREDVVDAFNHLVDEFNSAWWKQSIAIRWMMKGAIDQIRGDVEALLETMNHVVDHHTPVVSLFRASTRWTENVMTPASEIYSSIPPGSGNRALTYWDDEARAAYDDIVVEQQNATSAARDLAAFMSRWLSEIGRDNTTYLAHLVTEAGKVVSHLAAAATEAATVIGAPFAIQDIAGVIGQLVESLFSTLAKIAEDVTAAVDRVNNAENEVSDHSYFPGGDWPIAVTRA